MKIYIQTVWLFFVFAGSCYSQGIIGNFPDKNVVLKVSDESGLPLKEAQASITFSINQWSNSKFDAKKGLTDAGGVYAAEGRSDGNIDFSVRKEGFYLSKGKVKFNPFEGGKSSGQTLEREVLLKRIVKPIPMYGRTVITNIPKADAPVGFDLVEGDWVAPYGKGKQSDFLFSVKGEFADMKNFDSTMTLSFSAPDDGLLLFERGKNNQSALLSGHDAPLQGYLPERSWRRSRRPGQMSKDWVNDSNPNSNYYFRVRVKKDKDGKITASNYGKIYDDFVFDPRETKGAGYLKFTYYLNPQSNDSNVEFDLGKNLFQNLKNDEQVFNP